MPYTSSSASSSPARSTSSTPSPPPEPSTRSTPTPPPSPILDQLRKLDPESPNNPSPRTPKGKGNAKAKSSAPNTTQGATSSTAASTEKISVVRNGSASPAAVRIPWTSEERAEIVAHIVNQFETSAKDWQTLALKLPNRKEIDIRQQYKRVVFPRLLHVYDAKNTDGYRGSEEASSGAKQRAGASGSSSKKRSRQAFDKHEDGSSDECWTW